MEQQEIFWNDANGKKYSISLIGDHMKNQKAWMKEIGPIIGEQQARDCWAHMQKLNSNGQDTKSNDQ